MNRFAFAFAFALAACGPELVEESPALGACAVSCFGDGGESRWTEDATASPAKTCCDCRRSVAENAAEVCDGPVSDGAEDQCGECNDL
jgi:hypothetical protein